jgi:hypothetical protein
MRNPGKLHAKSRATSCDVKKRGAVRSSPRKKNKQENFNVEEGCDIPAEKKGEIFLWNLQS